MFLRVATDTDEYPFKLVDHDHGSLEGVTSPGLHEATYIRIDFVLNEPDTGSVAHGFGECLVEVWRALVQLLIEPRAAAVKSATGSVNRENLECSVLRALHGADNV